MLAVGQPVCEAASLSAPLGGAARHTKSIKIIFLEHWSIQLQRSGWREHMETSRKKTSCWSPSKTEAACTCTSREAVCARNADALRSTCDGSVCTEKKLRSSNAHAVHRCLEKIVMLHCSGTLHQKFRKEKPARGCCVVAASGQHLPKLTQKTIHKNEIYTKMVHWEYNYKDSSMRLMY